jgi:putative oxidoreductase
METLTNIGILVLRVVLGLIFVGHGTQKLFGWFGGHGMAGHTAFMDKLGLRPARLFAAVSALGETLGGLGVLAGLLTPLAACGIIGTMAVAAITVHWANGFWNHQGGVEYPVVLAVQAFVIGLAGPGPYSFDGVLGIGLPAPWTFLAALALTALTVAATVTRRPPQGRS